jgi:hypothetical protein
MGPSPVSPCRMGLSAILDRFSHEYALKDELDGAWAARPLEMVREPGRTLLVPMKLSNAVRAEGMAQMISLVIDEAYRRRESFFAHSRRIG